VERKRGAGFVNCAALSRHHGHTNDPMSRLFTFAEGSACSAVCTPQTTPPRAGTPRRSAPAGRAGRRVWPDDGAGGARDRRAGRARRPAVRRRRRA
jgi:hypothetical protein